MSRGFLVDLHRCVGCGSCVVACRLENRLPPRTSWRRVLPLNLARHPHGPTYHLSIACHHCTRPACVAGCPSGAYEKRPDGIVTMVEDRCVGCRYCEMACPFGAPQYDEARGVMGKCDMCSHLVDRGLQPACVAACPTGALQVYESNSAEPGHESVPGFEDIDGCGPRTRFQPPRGTRRKNLFEALERVLGRAAGGVAPGEG